MILGTHHVGISVAHLERSIQFYCTRFGMEVAVEGEFDGNSYADLMALEEAAGRAALLRLKGTSLQLELFEFRRPPPRAGDPNRPVCDQGITHFCVQVTNIESEYERLKAAGVVFHCPPRRFPSGNKATYARDPDGNVFELLELKADSQAGTAERMHPAVPSG